MHDIQIIIFSKNRTLQLKSLLMSLKHFTDIPEYLITIIYIDSEEISYDILKDQFKCEFYNQNNLIEDLKYIIYKSKKQYTLFFVDDLIIRDYFSIRIIEEFMNKNKSVQSLSLRLGMNIKDGESPKFINLHDNILSWNTESNLGNIWKYFWELSSSLYRTEFVIDYLNKCPSYRITSPNTLEYYYYSCMPSLVNGWKIKMFNLFRYTFVDKSNTIACFSKSKCVTQGVNKVSNILNPFETMYSVNELHEKMLNGYSIDFMNLQNIDITWPNAGNKYFKLIND